jgi:uncharacterized delta-60 repeat protein
MVLASGQLVVAGQTCTSSTACAFAVARFNQSGLPDSSFSTDGITTATFGADDATATAVVADGGGILVGGYLRPDKVAAIARFLSSGEPDPSFNSTGETTVGGYTSGLLSMLAPEDGRIIGLSLLGQLYAERADGTDRDPSFAGELFVGLLGSDGDLARDSRGRILVAVGSGGCERFCYPLDTALARVEPDGSNDPEFGGQFGVVTADLGVDADGAHALVVDDHDRPIVAGYSGERFVVGRFEAGAGPPDLDGDGVLDGDDGCPTVYGRAHTARLHGCPEILPRLTLRRRVRQDLWVGDAISRDQRCAPRQQILIYRRQRGPDDKLSKAEYVDDQSFEADGNLRPGVYYAQAKQYFRERIGNCLAARSNQVVIDG